MEAAIRHELRLSHHSIVLLGDAPLGQSGDAYARNMAITMFAKPNRICVIETPRSHDQEHIEPPDFEKPLRADGTILRHPGSAAILDTTDRPVVVICNTRSHDVGITLAVGPGLDGAYQLLLGNDQPGDHLYAYVVGSVLSRCFAEHQLRYIERQLIWRGVPRKNIHHDGRERKVQFAISRRRDDRYTTKQTVIVVHH